MLYSSAVATATTDPTMDKTQQHKFIRRIHEIHRRKATDTVAKMSLQYFFSQVLKRGACISGNKWLKTAARCIQLLY